MFSPCISSKRKTTRAGGDLLHVDIPFTHKQVKKNKQDCLQELRHLNENKAMLKERRKILGNF